MAIEGFKETLGVRTFISRKNLTPGKVIQFNYDGEQKYAIVLNPEWQNKMHALSLGALTPQTLSEILKLIGSETNGELIYEKFKNSNLVSDRPYRTYSISKISALREIFIKRSTVLYETEPTTENMYGEK